MLLDLSALSFIDSSGLRAIIEANDRASTRGWTLRLLHGPAAVRQVSKITHTEDRLPFV